MIKVSFVVAIYNVEKYLEQCIESIIKQEFVNIEVILVNDGSTDNSLKICEKFRKKDSRIKIINQENSGANVARNNGLNEATGEWVIFVDGDDYVEPKIITAVEELLYDEMDIICFSNKVIKNFKEYSVKHKKDFFMIEGKKEFEEMQLATLNRLGNYRYNIKTLDSVSIWNKLYRKDFLNNNNIRFVPKMPKLQDLTFNLLVYEHANKAVFFDYCGYCYRLNESSVSRKYQDDIIEKFVFINGWIKEFINNKDIRFEEAYYARLVTHLRTCSVLYLCNQKNKKAYWERQKIFLKLVKSVDYAQALERTSIMGLPFKEKILTFFIKHKLFLGCCILNRLNELIK